MRKNGDSRSVPERSNLEASVTRLLQGLRAAAPTAAIFVIIPIARYAAVELKTGVSACNATAPISRKTAIIDLGPAATKRLEADNLWSGIHPNLRGHATFAAQILASVVRDLATRLCQASAHETKDGGGDTIHVEISAGWFYIPARS